MLGEVISVGLDEVIEKVAKKKVDGYRFVTMSCVELDETTIDILYHLDKGLKLINFRLTVPRNAAVSSISPVYFAAFLVENEMQDLFDDTCHVLLSGNRRNNGHRSAAARQVSAHHLVRAAPDAQPSVVVGPLCRQLRL